MTRLDRYILAQILAALGCFILVFTGVVWLTQAVRLIDTVVASGQSARVFLEFSLLVLPQVFVIVLPLSGIGAALYALNKLYGDSELIVMMGSGLSPAAMLKLNEAEIAAAIKPVGFYRNKARTILDLSREILQNHGGEVPDTVEELVKFQGVGRKTELGLEARDATADSQGECGIEYSMHDASRPR